ncbi:type 2 isopentenyl-diphosphate Delta-isomerase [Shouchella lehensis]|uniref:Isopentenyl-diphosphate delta-isomerase n=1 Tax=Shouchella lehensis TaxID=300825 RepID=A0A4Y7WFE2_9BACI|nr:type 2 isopentenyl-diphosphate Delta-isomerase [Shouchella lehensis]MBG9784820.1 isopentenyl pyrophosphate isomerase [Shouchella lehensis]TES46230.1 type 2 isopentenyl-diphosphate Delta-isomerase [Shouchella lehensis]
MSREQRKHDHIQQAIQQEQTRSPFEDIQFIHQTLATSSFHRCQLETTFLHKFISSPLLINAMTGGGGKQTARINQQLAEVAQHFSIPMAVGSQMAAIKDQEQIHTYQIIRDTAPDIVCLANLGAEATPSDALRAIDMIEADGLQIHFNHIQELAMPEGDRDFSMRLRNLEAIVAKSPVPVIAKEVGFGMTKEAVKRLYEAGVHAVDVSGTGGTNFSQIENARRQLSLGFFNSWGVPTPIALLEARSLELPLPFIASGGITSSVDIAKALSLGASLVGMSGFFIKTLQNEGIDAVIASVTRMQEELRYMMTALNVHTVEELKNVPLIIKGETHHWLNERGIDTKAYASRS